MGFSIGNLSPRIQSDPQMSSAVGSSVDSVTAGIQSTQSSGIGQVTDSLEQFAACFPPVGTAPSPEAGFADAATISSADVYFRQAGEAGDVNGFSELTQMNEVLTKLTDPNFDYQTSLTDFANVLKDVQLPAASQGPQSSESIAISGNEPGAESSSIVYQDSQALTLLENNAESQAISGNEPEPGALAESGAFVDGSLTAESGALVDGGIPAGEGSAITGNLRLQNLQGALQQILDLNQGGKING